MRIMKDSGIEWIGQVPSHWNVRKIKQLKNPNEVNSFEDGDWIESPYITDNGIRYLTTGNIGDGIFKSQGTGYISKETFTELNCKYAYPNDLVFSRLNAPYGRSCILPNTCSEYVIAVDNVILRTEEEKRYICYITQCNGYQHAVEDEAKGTTMKRVSRTNLGNIKIVIPPLSEQKVIADFLDKQCAEIDAVIEKTKETIEEYKKLKQSIITEAVTKGIRGERSMKDSGIEWIGDIPADWNVSKLKYVCQINTEFVDPRTGEFDNLPHIGPGNIEKFTGRLTEYKYVKDEGLISGKYHFRANEIVYGKINPQLGKVAFPQFEGLCSADAYPIRTFEQIIVNKFLLYFMLSRGFIDATILASLRMGMPKINSFDLMNLSIVVPSVAEQQKIIGFLEHKCAEIDTLIEKKTALLEEMESYKKSVIYEYVTGKKEVK